MTDQEVRADHFKQAEVSCLLEGLDSSGDVFFQAVKARVISGEIDMDEMLRLLLEDSKSNYEAAGANLAQAS